MSKGESSSSHISLTDRCVAAGGASIVSALVVNPLDVVKTRLQSQAAGLNVGAASLPAANTGLAQVLNLAGSSGCQCVIQAPPAPRLPSAHCPVYHSTWDGLRKIVRQEGVLGLWRGTTASLLMAIPSVGIYLPLYDYLLLQGQPLGGAAPLVAGVTARTAAVFCTAPLELVRTRLQAGMGGTGPWWQLGLGVRGVGGLWRGLAATLARDVPFSAIYWGVAEPIRENLRHWPGGDHVEWVELGMTPGDPSMSIPEGTGAEWVRVVGANVAAGGIAGAFAAGVTTPLDVVKTQAQVSDGRVPLGVMKTLRQLAVNGGVRALFAGWAPRALKAAPACAIVLSAYEALKFGYAARGMT